MNFKITKADGLSVFSCPSNVLMNEIDEFNGLCLWSSERCAIAAAEALVAFVRGN